MIYKFIGNTDAESDLEISQKESNKVILKMDNSFITLDPNNLYNLIGALHTLQAKIKNNG